MSVFLAYLYYFVVASASPLQRRSLAKKKAHLPGQWTFIFLSKLVILALTPLLFIFWPPRLTGNIDMIVVVTVICALQGAFYAHLTNMAIAHVEAGLSTVVLNIYTPATITLSAILLKESVTGLQIVGTVLLVLAMYILSVPHRVSRFRFDKWFLMLLGLGISLSVYLVCERWLIRETGLGMAVLLSWSSMLIPSGIMALRFREKLSYTVKEIVTTGTLSFLQFSSWSVLTLVVGNLSIVSSVTTFKIVVMFILGALFLKERSDIRRKLLGSSIAIFGLLMMK